MLLFLLLFVFVCFVVVFFCCFFFVLKGQGFVGMHIFRSSHTALEEAQPKSTLTLVLLIN